jgi:hypothetical protein
MATNCMRRHASSPARLDIPRAEVLRGNLDGPEKAWVVLSADELINGAGY